MSHHNIAQQNEGLILRKKPPARFHSSDISTSIHSRDEPAASPRNVAKLPDLLRKAFHRKADRVADHLCRPGGDRDRERAIVRRSSSTHPRAFSVGRGEFASRHHRPHGVAVYYSSIASSQAVIASSQHVAARFNASTASSALCPFSPSWASTRYLAAPFTDRTRGVADGRRPPPADAGRRAASGGGCILVTRP